MAARHPQNTNLTLHTQGLFQGLPAQLHRGPLIKEYLEQILRTICNALREHPRTFAVRVDLHLPDYFNYLEKAGTSVISRFTASLKAQVSADIESKSRKGLRVHPCTVRHIWAKEKNSSLLDHYHVVLFFNRDAYNRLGSLTADSGNIAARIKRAWASALGVDFVFVENLVQFAKNGTYCVNAGSVPDNRSASEIYWDDINGRSGRPLDIRSLESLFARLSYLAKADSKNYGDRSKSFDCSRA